MNSLKEQLMQAGLAEKKSVGKKNKQARKPKSERKKASEATQLAEKKLQEKAIADRELNRLRHIEQEKKAQVAQIKQLIETAKIDSSDGEVAYNFTHSSKVKTIYVNEAQQQQLARNQISIVSLEDRYYLVPNIVASKIGQRDESFLINTLWSEPTDSEDDPYAGYEIPDDMMW